MEFPKENLLPKVIATARISRTPRVPRLLKHCGIFLLRFDIPLIQVRTPDELFRIIQGFNVAVFRIFNHDLPALMQIRPGVPPHLTTCDTSLPPKPASW